LHDLSAHQLVEVEQLIEERRSIEQNVTQAMGYASDVVSAAAARASRYHGTGGQSVWSWLEHDVHDVSDFVTGIWDGGYDMAAGLIKTLWSLGVLSFKLSGERLLLDPQGFAHDAEHAAATLTSTVDSLAHNKQQFVASLLNLDELRKNPIHWFGELVPTIVATLLSMGAGGAASAAAKGGEITDAIDSTADVASTGVTISARTADHITDGYFNSHDVPVGFHSAPDGIAPLGRRINSIVSINKNGTYRAEVSFQKYDGTWVPKEVEIQTMFPNSWSKSEVLHAVQVAFDNRYMIDQTTWEQTYNGVVIQGYLKSRTGELITAFPAPEQ
jgi:hypothetical protein